MEKVIAKVETFIASDGKKFRSEEKCIEHEKYCERIELCKSIHGMTLEELLSVYSEEAGYPLNIFEFAEEKKLFDLEDALLTKINDGNWAMGTILYDSFEITCKGVTVQEVIYKFAVLKHFHLCRLITIDYLDK